MKYLNLIVVLSLLLMSQWVVAEKIYKWKDENGTIHYSKEPRDGAQDSANVNQQISISKEKKGDYECCRLVEKAIRTMLTRDIQPYEKAFEPLFNSANFNVEELNNFVGAKATTRSSRYNVPKLGYSRCMSAGFRFCRTSLPRRTVESNKQAKSGSGFLVSNSGHIVTNEHVAGECKSIKIQPMNVIASLIAKDAKFDLALLKIDSVEANYSKLRVGSPVLGEEIIVAGYPYKGLLSSDVKITSGIVSSLAGIQNNDSLLQITAPIQPGNSGGPLIDKFGNVIGVIVSKLNTEFMLRNFNDLPQNINFAIKAGILKKFLYKNGVDFKEVHSETKLELTEISKQAQNYTVEVSCIK